MKKKKTKKSVKKKSTTTKDEALFSQEENETQPKKENTNSKQEVERREKSQTAIIFVFIVLLFMAFLVPYFYTKNQRIFEYGGVTWQVEEETDVTFYHTQFEKIFQNQSFGFHNTFLRNDPRTNNVPLEVSNLTFFRQIAITSSPDVLTCDKQILVTDALTQITLAMPLYNKQTIFGISDEQAANESNKEYITCENKPDKTTVISVEMGDETKVTEDRDNKCYTITVKDCEDNLLAGEKFVIEVIKQVHDIK